MLQSHGLRCIDQLLREIMANENWTPSPLPFGRKPLLLGGDFRQTLPVVQRGTRAQIVEACIKSSSLWRHFKQLKLSTNMRTGGAESQFTEFLLKVGDGRLQNDVGLDEDIIEIPQNMVETGDLIQTIFGEAIDPETVHTLAQSVILTSKNDDALKLNERVLE